MAESLRAVESAVFTASLALTLSVAAVTSVAAVPTPEPGPAVADRDATPELVEFVPSDLSRVVFQVPAGVEVGEVRERDPLDAYRGLSRRLEPLELVELLEGRGVAVGMGVVVPEVVLVVFVPVADEVPMG